jgi:hypothetical protein
MSDATRVLERLMEDDYVHEQLGAAMAQISGAYKRVRALPGREAVKDQTLYDRVRGAAGSLQSAARRAFGEPEPPPKRRGRRLAALSILIGVGALARAMDRAQRGQA